MIARESEAQLTETRCTAQEFQRYLTTNYATLALENGVYPAAWSAVCSAEDLGEDCEVIRARLYEKEGFVTNAMNLLRVTVGVRERDEE